MQRRAFSLVEVVIAVGVFAGSIAVILALLSSLTSQAAHSADLLAAQRVPEALRVELQRLARSGGFDALAARVPALSAPLADGLGFVASRDVTRLHARDYLAPPASETLPERERYFLIEAWRFTTAPLASEASGAVLPVHVRVSWPYRATGTATSADGRDALTFTLALSR